ncbi:MAG: T9SS type A sorting domain-containing protein [Moheibacter sp.]
MKKIYFLAAIAFGVTVNAQLSDGFESYPLGPYYGGAWTNWSMAPGDGSENIIITDEQASEGTQSGFIGNNEIQDAIWDVGMKTGGTWTFSLDFYIDFGSSGYFNAQHDLGALGSTGNWAYQSYIGIDPTVSGTPPNPGTFYFASGGTAYSFPYMEEEWINFGVEQDMVNNIVKLFLDGVQLDFGTDIPFGDDPAFQGKVNGYDFYSASPVNFMFIDNLKFYEGQFTMGVNDVDVTEISVYPTVTKDVVNIAAKTNIDNVAVYSTSGQQVLRLNPNSTNAQFNVSALPAGVYMVKIQSGKQVLTKKIIVK